MVTSKFHKEQLHLLQNAFTRDSLRSLAQKQGTPLQIINSSLVIERYRGLETLMPRVTPHFAVKSCPAPELLQIYKSISARLDVATTGEIEILRAIQYPPELLIHTHPHKRAQDMKAAYDYGIRTFVLDNVSEIPVLEPYKKDINLLFRLSFPNKYAAIDLSYKFGLEPNEAVKAVYRLLDEGYTVSGVSFHVGSQTESVVPYVEALHKTAEFFAKVKAERSVEFSLLDIGGGFPAPYVANVLGIHDFADAINDILDTDFSGVNIISEPGRYLVNPCVTLLTSVVSKSKRGSENWLFIDDGVYGSFSDMIAGHMTYELFGIQELDGAKPSSRYIVGGPTCDSIDIVDQKVYLPKMDRDDLIIVPNIGAYSYALATEFNSLPKPSVVIV